MNVGACPRCQRPLTPAPHDGLMLDVCAGCGGTWYDRAELEQALAEHVADPSPVQAFHEEHVQYLHCPRCLGRMTRRVYQPGAGVVLDYCGHHGVWLDAGELERVRAWLGGSGPRRRAEIDADDARIRASMERYGVSRSAGAFATSRLFLAPLIPR